jgi:hypothetical protein
MAMVEPDLAPARPFIPRPLPTPTPERRTPDSAPNGDGLDLALSSARAAVAAAEKTVADLSRIARARARAKQGPGREEESRISALEALDAANLGLKSLRAALAADPDNISLKRAIQEADKAVGQLEERLGRERPTSSSR